MVNSISQTNENSPHIIDIILTIWPQLIHKPSNNRNVNRWTNHGSNKNQNRFFFQTILNVTKVFQNGIIDSRHFLPAFLNIIHIQTIKNNIKIQQIIKQDIVNRLTDNKLSRLVWISVFDGKALGSGITSANTGILFFVNKIKNIMCFVWYNILRLFQVKKIPFLWIEEDLYDE